MAINIIEICNCLFIYFYAITSINLHRCNLQRPHFYWNFLQDQYSIFMTQRINKLCVYLQKAPWCFISALDLYVSLTSVFPLLRQDLRVSSSTPHSMPCNHINTHTHRWITHKPQYVTAILMTAIKHNVERSDDLNTPASKSIKRSRFYQMPDIQYQCVKV